MQALEQARADYPDARHHCWAYLLGAPSNPVSAAMSDDGEPSGTAGKPILNVMQHKELGDVMLIVIRYFGGIKLGAGGLVRAYSTAAQQAYDLVQTTENIVLDKHILQCSFSDEQHIRHWLTQHKGQVNQVDYSEQVTLTIELPPAALSNFKTFLSPIKNTALIEINHS